jgi:AcrR family transcriptional regulator
MAGLREQQKQQRQSRILEVARQKFHSNRYRDVTIESIADEAGLSAMTVFNYYGSKGGLLLSLVAESDRHLMFKIKALLESEFESAKTAVTDFSQIIFDHAFSYLDRSTWRHVLAISIQEGGSSFGRGYAALDREIEISLARLLKHLKKRNLIGSDFDATVAAKVIYNIHNAHFIEYASNEELTRDKIDTSVGNGLGFVLDRLL